jgi:hypothetical protein
LPTENDSSIFREIRNYLVGRAIGITRDEALMQEVVKFLLRIGILKIYNWNT